MTTDRRFPHNGPTAVLFRLRRPVLTALTALATVASAPAQAGGVDTVGRAAAKKFANLGRLPDPNTIVVADMVNYHRHGIPLPRAGQQVALDLRWDVPIPSNYREGVLQIGLSTPRVHDAAHLAPLNLALVIDRSGSMGEAEKMTRVKQALRSFVKRLRPTDRLSIVAYSTEADIVCPTGPVGDGAAVLHAIESLRPDGNTNLHAGLMCGYEQVAKNRAELGDAAHRVILMTDGLANRGCTDPNRIATDSQVHNKAGVDLSTIGFGTDFNHALLDRLAKAGRGTFHFVADDEDIEKVFVAESQSLMGMVARDVVLRLEHSTDLEVLHVYGHEPIRTKNGFRLPLDNFNYGMTRVVLVKIRCAKNLGETSKVRAELEYRATKNDETRSTIRAESKAPALTAGTIDHEVRKNFTIAVMARGLHRMAKCAKSKRFAEADGYLQRALQYAREQYPDSEDHDLVSVRRMLEKYQRVLKSRIEVYRDL